MIKTVEKAISAWQKTYRVALHSEVEAIDDSDTLQTLLASAIVTELTAEDAPKRVRRKSQTKTP